MSVSVKVKTRNKERYEKEEIVAYTVINFKTKRALKEAIAEGRQIEVFQPGGLFELAAGPGTCSLEGPHSPLPHKWYARCEYDSHHCITKLF
jgi:hypothetical protein